MYGGMSRRFVSAALTTARLSCPIPGGLRLFTVRGDSLVVELRLPDGTKFGDVRSARSTRLPPARK